MKTVVVTGSSGFVAHHTIPLLKKAGYNVVPFDIVEGNDIRKPEDLRKVLVPGCKVLHLAAVARFDKAEEDPVTAYSTNGGGVAVLLREADNAGVERVVLASTASVYMPVGAWQRPIAEYHPTLGNSPYAISKCLGERQVGFSKVPFVILRYAHLYGVKKWHGGLIDAFLSRIARGAEPIMFGGLQSNDFTSVKDVARANLLALETPYVNEVYNVGTGQHVTTAEAVAILSELTGYKGGIEHRPMRIVDAPNFVLDVSKAERLLKYTPEWEFRAGLEDMLCGA